MRLEQFLKEMGLHKELTDKDFVDESFTTSKVEEGSYYIKRFDSKLLSVYYSKKEVPDMFKDKLAYFDVFRNGNKINSYADK